MSYLAALNQTAYGSAVGYYTADNLCHSQPFWRQI